MHAEIRTKLNILLFLLAIVSSMVLTDLVIDFNLQKELPNISILKSEDMGKGVYKVKLKNEDGKIFSVTLPLSSLSSMGIDADSVLLYTKRKKK